VWKAEPGERGGSKDCSGHSGASVTLRLPVGTVVHDAATGRIVADLSVDGGSWIAAHGGRGGRGNASYKNSINQAPREYEPGGKGEAREMRLELKLLADVGLLGFPNAGKSTLLARVSAARPKVAAYPFTTLEPNLGTVRLDGAPSFVIADLPGLIEGASRGEGLGHRFLRHVERTSNLVHLIDCSNESDPVTRYRTIRAELAAYSAQLAERPEIVVGTKVDVPGAWDRVAALERALPDREVFGLSCMTGEGLNALMAAIVGRLPRLPEEAARAV
ncbi:MAG: Obg family GTPase CgtA, partial [Planctomycetes bacterium]|nr:Obg family GTPase CgtA [Planctomycetota bacterium]